MWCVIKSFFSDLEQEPGGGLVHGPDGRVSPARGHRRKWRHRWGTRPDRKGKQERRNDARKDLRRVRDPQWPLAVVKKKKKRRKKKIYETKFFNKNWGKYWIIWKKCNPSDDRSEKDIVWNLKFDTTNIFLQLWKTQPNFQKSFEEICLWNVENI